MESISITTPRACYICTYDKDRALAERNNWVKEEKQKLHVREMCDFWLPITRGTGLLSISGIIIAIVKTMQGAAQKNILIWFAVALGLTILMGASTKLVLYIKMCNPPCEQMPDIAEFNGIVTSRHNKIQNIRVVQDVQSQHRNVYLQWRDNSTGETHVHKFTGFTLKHAYKPSDCIVINFTAQTIQHGVA